MASLLHSSVFRPFLYRVTVDMRQHCTDGSFRLCRWRAHTEALSEDSGPDALSTHGQYFALHVFYAILQHIAGGLSANCCRTITMTRYRKHPFGYECAQSSPPSVTEIPLSEVDHQGSRGRRHLPVSGNFTVLKNFPKLFISLGIWETIAYHYGTVSENFTILELSCNYPFFHQFCLFLPVFSRLDVRIFYRLQYEHNAFGRLFISSMQAPLP